MQKFYYRSTLKKIPKINEGSRLRQREKLGCDTIATETPGNPVRDSGAGIALSRKTNETVSSVHFLSSTLVPGTLIIASPSPRSLFHPTNVGK